ncbi:hypothetical protein Agub_g1235 [Astrephomene gubernaculifera]|uniref:Uncharacterized protein n=1 Tax=Astrephomene gubernaculifera TaxID=47775 RepID=A0AAD3DF48_9CHLO|nr:hypothetical protein Agub_g1235 [Astrephomene gubernaculifera]
MLLNALADRPKNMDFLETVAVNEQNLCSWSMSPVPCIEGPRQPVEAVPFTSAQWPKLPAYLWRAAKARDRETLFLKFLAAVQWKERRLKEKAGTKAVATSAAFPAGGMLWSLTLEQPDDVFGYMDCFDKIMPESRALYAGRDKLGDVSEALPVACLVVRAERAEHHWHPQDVVTAYADMTFTPGMDGGRALSNVDNTYSTFMRGLHFSFTAARPYFKVALTWRDVLGHWPHTDEDFSAALTGESLLNLDSFTSFLFVHNVTTHWHADSKHEEAELGRSLSSQLLLYRVLEGLQVQHQWCGDCDRQLEGRPHFNVEEEEPIQPGVYLPAPDGGEGGDGDAAEYENHYLEDSDELLLKPGPLRPYYTWRGRFRTRNPAELLTLVLIASGMECWRDMKLKTTIQWLQDVLDHLTNDAQQPGAFCAKRALPYFEGCRDRAHALRRINLTEEGLPLGLRPSRLRLLARPSGVGGRLWRTLQAMMWHCGVVPTPRPFGACGSGSGNRSGRTCDFDSCGHLQSCFGDYLTRLIETGAGSEDVSKPTATGNPKTCQREPDWSELLKTLPDGSLRYTGSGGGSSSEDGCRLVPWSGGDEQRRKHLAQEMRTQHRISAAWRRSIVAVLLVVTLGPALLVLKWLLSAALAYLVPMPGNTNEQPPPQQQQQRIGRQHKRNKSEKSRDERNQERTESEEQVEDSIGIGEYLYHLCAFTVLFFAEVLAACCRAGSAGVTRIGGFLTGEGTAAAAGIIEDSGSGTATCSAALPAEPAAAGSSEHAGVGPSSRSKPTAKGGKGATTTNNSGSGSATPRTSGKDSKRGSKGAPKGAASRASGPTGNANPEAASAGAVSTAAAAAAVVAGCSNADTHPVGGAAPSSLRRRLALSRAAGERGSIAINATASPTPLSPPAPAGRLPTANGAAAAAANAARTPTSPPLPTSATAIGPGTAAAASGFNLHGGGSQQRLPNNVGCASPTLPTPLPGPTGPPAMQAVMATCNIAFAGGNSSGAAPSPAVVPSFSSSPRVGDTDDRSCLVCLDAAREFGFLHGGMVHTGVCGECAELLRSRGPDLECIVCRQQVESMVGVYGI